MQLQTNRYVMIGASLVTALAIGFVMQKSGGPGGGQAQALQPSAPAESNTLGGVAPAQPAAQPAGQDPVIAPVEIRDVRRTAAPTQPETPRAAGDGSDGPVLAALGDTGTEMAPPPDAETAAFDCPVEMTATPMAAAMVQLRVSADCAPNEWVTIHHNGLMFTEVTDDAGVLEIGVPALATQSVFISAFANGEGSVAMAEVPDLAQYHRVVLQWGGEPGLSLHAMEFGAGFGQDGHVWMDQAGSLADVVAGTGGVMTWLGATDVPKPLVAEVYTFPAGLSQGSGDIDLSVELEVTAATCGTDLALQTIEVAQAGTPAVQDLQLFVPECDSQGDFLVLNDVLETLKIAAN